MIRRPIALSLTVFLFLPHVRAAAPALAAPFGDCMVLQRDMPVPVWGTADPGSQIRVTFAGQTQTTTTDAAGKWMLKLTPLPACAENRTLTVSSGGGTTEARDVLVGEVWICAGQSNMEMGVTMCLDADKEINAANDPLLRIKAINKVLSPVPATALPTATPWQPATPQSLRKSGAWGGFSATAYFFARHLRQQLKVPVGVVQSAWGGTIVEPWTPPQGFAMVPSLKDISDKVAKFDGEYRANVAKHLDALADFEKKARTALSNNSPLPPPPPAITHPVNAPTHPTALFNGHIHPMIPYAIRGALWYQGESNLLAGDTTIYQDKMAALIGGWRNQWGQGDFPFYFVQIAPFTYKLEPTRLPEFWAAQTLAAETIPNTGMAVTNDIGDFNDIHPKNKQEVGRRLALIAMAKTYGLTKTEWSGPRFKSFTAANGAATVRFDHAGGGVVSSDGKPLTGFEIAGEDDVFFPATATAKDDTVVLTSDKVAAPARARYAWNQCPQANAANREKLPMNSFITPGPANLALNARYTTTNPNTHGFGASGQLTDGSWAADAQHCFATNEDDTFPKDQIIDLGAKHPLRAVKFGVPPFGSTKTIVVSLSDDGTTFIPAGSHEFAQNKADTAVIPTPGKSARFIKLSAPDHHEAKVQYDSRFIFLTEVEVLAQETR